MSIQSHGHEHEMEPQYGLPERLPAGEKILWQGSPDFRAVALRVFHVRMVAIYFAVLLALRAGFVLNDGGGVADALISLAWPLPLALTALASLTALAWMTASTAVYTLTDKRIVMRIGVVLTLTFNIPLRTLKAAALRQGLADTGDIVIELAGPDQIAWLHLWPHVRPWHVARPQPMLRAVPEAAVVAGLLAQAWSAVTGAPAAPAASSQPAAAPAAAETAGGHAAGHWQPSPT